MINLIPPEGKRRVRREYLLRVASVWLLLIAAAAGVIAVTLAPTYVLLSARANALSAAYTRIMKDDEAVYAESQRAIARANALAAQLNRSGAAVMPSAIFAAVEHAQTSEIVVRGFSYTENDKNPDIQIAGTAATREALVRFRDALERDPLFVTATVPVASLAKDVDVPFTMTLTIAP